MVFGTYVDKEGYVDRIDPDQTSEHLWTENVQTRFWNICGQRIPEQTWERMWTTKTQTRLRNICGERMPQRDKNICGLRSSRIDFGTCVDREDLEQTSESIWTELETYVDRKDLDHTS